MTDAINPDHYKRLPAEAIEIIESAIEGAESVAGFFQGQALKYLLRLNHKGCKITDAKKAKWYLDRLVNLLDEREKQKAADLQSLKDHPFGKPKRTPKIGDWVKINKPESNPAWMPGMDQYDGQIVEVKEIDDEPSNRDDWAYVGTAIIHDEWAFCFDWLEPVKAPLNSDKIPEGYRKLGDSSNEPRNYGDLRWSVAEKRYVEISGDEIGYANRDNWAACRKITGEATEEVTGEVKPPDGWRFLERGEVIRKGDKYLDMKSQAWSKCSNAIGDKLEGFHKPTIRRNKFEVGENVVVVKTGEVFKLLPSLHAGMYGVDDRAMPYHYLPEELAPYIEDAK